jgi:hypothetical protein
MYGFRLICPHIAIDSAAPVVIDMHSYLFFVPLNYTCSYSLHWMLFQHRQTSWNREWQISFQFRIHTSSVIRKQPIMKNYIFWDITPCSPYVNLCFGRKFCLVFALPAACFMQVSCLAYPSTVKTEATCSTKTSVDFQRTTRCYISESRRILHNCHENLKIRHNPLQVWRHLSMDISALGLSFRLKIGLLPPPSSPPRHVHVRPH